ncbi:MAG: Rpp14/Pop5 family protein [archaeon]
MKKQVKQSLKTLPKSYRQKHRYVLFKVFSEKRLAERDVYFAFWNSLKFLVGSKGVSESGFNLKKFNSEKGFAVVKCFLPAVNVLKSTGLFVQEVNGVKASVMVEKVSGVVNKFEKALK